MTGLTTHSPSAVARASRPWPIARMRADEPDRQQRRRDQAGDRDGLVDGDRSAAPEAGQQRERRAHLERAAVARRELQKQAQVTGAQRRIGRCDLGRVVVPAEPVQRQERHRPHAERAERERGPVVAQTQPGHPMLIVSSRARLSSAALARRALAHPAGAIGERGDRRRAPSWGCAVVRGFDLCALARAGALVAWPAPREIPLLAHLRSGWWAMIPALSVVAFVFGERALCGLADGLTYLALIAVPPLAAVAPGLGDAARAAVACARRRAAFRARVGRSPGPRRGERCAGAGRAFRRHAGRVAGGRLTRAPW